MTGYTVHTGSTEQFSEGWDRIFADGKKRSQASKTSSGGKSKTTKKKSTGRKKSGKSRKKK